MPSDHPLVSVIVPMVNERQDIRPCLDAVGAQDYGLDFIEVIVVDGGSRDDSQELAQNALSHYPFARVEFISHPGGNTPSNLNAGLAAAAGDIVVRIDARSVVPYHYVATVARILTRRPDIAVVGGAQLPAARPGAGLVASAIARALRNPYLTGLARYRTRASSGPTDTVYLGAFRRRQLVEEGGWNEAFDTNQDYELNRRMAGRGLVWFERSLRVIYRPRSTMKDLVGQYRRFGRWKAALWLETRSISSRHVGLLAAGVLTLLIFPRWLMRRPLRRGAGAVAAAVAADGTVREPGGLLLRMVSLLASGASIGAWLLGIFEQTLRFLKGERFIHAADGPDRAGMG